MSVRLVFVPEGEAVLRVIGQLRVDSQRVWALVVVTGYQRHWLTKTEWFSRGILISLGGCQGQATLTFCYVESQSHRLRFRWELASLAQGETWVRALCSVGLGQWAPTTPVCVCGCVCVGACDYKIDSDGLAVNGRVDKAKVLIFLTDPYQPAYWH